MSGERPRLSVLVVTVGVTSHLNQAFRVADRLAARGHAVAFASADDRARAAVEAQGLEFVLLEREHAQRTRLAGSPFARMSRLRRALAWRERVALERQHAEATLANDELEELVERRRPDVVLVDYELHPAIVRLAVGAVPLMLVEYHCSPIRLPGLPIPSSPRLPSSDRFGRVALDLGWRLAHLRRRARLTARRVALRGHDWWSTLHELARQVGYDLAAETSRRHWPYLVHRNLPTLYLGPPDLDFPHEPPNRRFRVGPMIAVDRREPAADPAYVEYAARRASESSRPRLVYCAMGSILANAAYYRRVIRAVAGHPEWELVLAAGRGASPAELGSLPPNVHVFGYVPQLDVLAGADLMLHHAGLATIAECVFFGVPMLAYSGGVLEEDGNAARVEFHGLGLRGDLDRDQPEEIATKIGTVLDDPRYRRSVEAMRARFLERHRDDGWVGLVERRATASAAELGWEAL